MDYFNLPHRDYDEYELNRELDRVKTSVFRRHDAAFFGPLLCGMDFRWDTGIHTAGTNGKEIIWNPYFFMDAPERFNSPRFNDFVLMHELWHVARLHMLRVDNRCPDYWNYACDVRINNDLVTAGYDFGIFPAWFKPEYDIQNGEPMSEEDIYDLIFKNPPSSVPISLPQSPWGEGGDIINDPGSADAEAVKIDAINNVVKAIQSAKVSGQPGAIPGSVEQIVDQFLSPVIPWETHVRAWMTDMLEHDYTWSRPNRRYTDMYLPSPFVDEGRLEHLIYFQDVSGSISDNDIVRFNSELKYVWDEFKPTKMTVVQFDTHITEITEFNEGDNFDRIKITGRGGTSLIAVRQMIEDLKPTGAIIFTDMEVEPMKPLTQEIPILWVCTNNPEATVPFGKLIHIKT